MGRVVVSQCFVDYLELVGDVIPEHARRGKRCGHCRKLMNRYQSAVSKHCCLCSRKFKQIEDGNGIFHYPERGISRADKSSK